MTAATENDEFTTRAYRGETDYWLIRQLLVETYPTIPLGVNWEVRRWDGWFWQDADRGRLRRGPQDDVRLWQTADERLVAAVFSEDGGGDAHLQIRPGYRWLEPDMLTWAEEHLAGSGETASGTRHLSVTVYDHDTDRLDLVLGRGYRAVWPVVARRMTLGPVPPPGPRPVEGYRLRALRPGDLSDLARLACVLNAGFRRDCHTAQEQAGLTTAPCYRADLQLVAEADDGSFAAHIAFSIDDVNRRAILEPVCTDPAHGRKGLASALIAEGVRRVAATGVRDLYVEATNFIPNDLYRSAGFRDAYPGFVYRRTLPG